MFCSLNLELIQALSSTVAALSVVVAVLKYFYEKSRDRKISVADQVNFFRTEVMSKNDEFVQYVRDRKGESYKFERVPLDEPTIEYSREQSMSQSQKQTDLINELKCLNKETDILNALEEISLRVIFNKTLKHKALTSIKAPFVELVEIHAIALLFSRFVTTGGETYSAILQVYNKWKEEVDRRPATERHKEVVEKLGLK